jgi:hypothetical protein
VKAKSWVAGTLFDLSEVKGKFFELDYIFGLFSRVWAKRLTDNSNAVLANRINFFMVCINLLVLTIEQRRCRAQRSAGTLYTSPVMVKQFCLVGIVDNVTVLVKKLPSANAL